MKKLAYLVIPIVLAIGFFLLSRGQIEAVAPQAVTANGVVGETGRVSLNNSIDGGYVATVNLAHTYNNPVVVAFMNTYNRAESVDVRVRNVTSNSFELFMQEPDNGGHFSESVSYIVVEAGRYQLYGGLEFEAGTVDTNSVHVTGNPFGGVTVPFSEAFATTPAVLHTLNSYNNGDFMSSVVSSVGNNDFVVQQESGGSGSAATTETIGWIAFAVGSGTHYDKTFEIGRALDGTFDGNDDGTPQNISFFSFGMAPDVVVKGNSGNGIDGYWARGAGIYNATTQTVWAEEDQVADTERNHADELFAWAAFEPNTVFWNINFSPVATNNSYLTLANTNVSGNLITDNTGNGIDSDPERELIVVDSYTTPAVGALLVEPNGVFTYTPALDWAGTVTATYTITDGASTDTGTVTFVVTTPPVATDNSYTIPEDTAVSGNLITDDTGNGVDSDPDGDAIGLHDYTAPSVGSLTVAYNGLFTYTPAVNWFGTISFTYAISDSNFNPVGTGNFGSAAHDSFGAGNSNSVAVGDVDGDGDLDVVIANMIQSQEVWLNDGAGNFGTIPYHVFGGAASSRSVALGDLDGDGDLDAVVAHDLDEAQEVWLNDGTGNFGTSAYHSFGSGLTMAVALGDVNGDGDLDIVLANRGGQGQVVWQNNGTGNFGTSPYDIFGSGDSFDIALADVDGDGDLDAVIANANQAQEVWVNNGSGNFGVAPPYDSFGGGNSFSVAVGDVDGDGDMDAVVANYNQPQEVWLNDGAGDFGTAAHHSFGGGDSYGVTLGDLDGDGDLDAVIANYSNEMQEVWLNDGTGNFGAVAHHSFSGGNSFDVALEDMDGDGDLDAVIANSTDQAQEVWLNQNGKQWVTSNRATVTITVTAVDDDPPVATDDSYVTPEDTAVSGNLITDDTGNGVDYDPDLDPVAVDQYTAPAEGIFILQPNGAFTYTPALNWNGTLTATYTISDGALVDTATVTLTVTAVDDSPIATDNSYVTPEDTAVSGNIITDDTGNGADYDPEGHSFNLYNYTVPLTGSFTLADTGLFTYTPPVNWNGSVTFTYVISEDAPIIYNAGEFAATAHDSFGGGDSTIVAVGDVDGDGDLDAVIANFNQPQEVWLNDGTGNFGTVAYDSFGGGSTLGLVLGDVNGDGDLDVVIANTNDQAQEVWLNDGTGNFGATAYDSFGMSYSQSVALGDVDGDNDLDAIVANGFDQTQEVWLNDGTGNFGSAAHDTFGAGYSQSVALGDVDGDGDLDAVIANWGQAQQVWLNAGNGTFGAAAYDSFGAGDSTAVALGDVDGDGDLDAVIANWGQAQQVWLNAGNGTFGAAAHHTFGAGDSTAVAVGDVDIDGDLDIVVANDSGQAEEVWFNDGTGNFGAAPYDSFGAGASEFVALGDVNGDGALDAVVANWGQAQEVWLNQYDLQWFMSTPATVTITVTAVNGPPIATDNSYTTLEDTAVSGNLITDDTGNGIDSDIDMDTLLVDQYTAPAVGTFVVQPNGTFTYTPALGWNGTLTASYTISDGALLDTAAVTLTVTAVDYPPVATDNSYTTPQETPVGGNLITDDTGNGADSDADGDNLSVYTYTLPITGALTLESGGAFTYTPPVNWYGAVTFTYAISDDNPALAGTGDFGPTFHSSFGSFGNSRTRAIALGDVDGDGDLDAVLANRSGQAQEVWLNDGAGNFGINNPHDSFGAGDTRSVALGDIDGDGDLDAVFANYNAPQEVWLNDGAGNFGAAAHNSFGAGYSLSMALGDVDGDGDLDAVIANTTQAQEVWLNDGSGNFGAAAHHTFGGGNSESVALGDVDGDGDLDAVIANWWQAQEVWLNDGAGNFGAAAHHTFGVGSSTSVAVADVDGDGDLDAVIGNFFGEAQEVWLNDGAGNFGAAAHDAFGAGDSTFVALGDVDADGDPDAVIANANGLAQEAWLNDGSGNFGTVAYDSFSAGNSQAVALGDMDGDGSLDAVIANDSDQVQEVWLNQTGEQWRVSNTAMVTVTVLADGVAPQVAINALDANDAQLTWSPDGVNCGYQVHAAGAPYFTADAGNTLSGELADTADSYVLSGAISGGSNIFYKLMGVGCSGVDAPSNEVGIFHFAITPGD
ncbi:MAG TPA: FG-GAP-like repeat-containing protein [Anaerolineae bacterium]|nr:FG-GAP-like repeat-containing protein [Anaerolineae bacterium]